MVDIVIRVTVLAVLVLGTINTVQSVALLVRLIRHVARHRPRWGLDLWVPAFTSVSDVRRWLEAWRAALGSGDPAVTGIRSAARTVASRQLYLALLSHTWAMAVSSLAPQLI